MIVDGWDRFWVSDEYGPYVYHFDAAGHLLQALQPPSAVLPRIGGKLNFTSETDPDTGRVGNQGAPLFNCARLGFTDTDLASLTHVSSCWKMKKKMRRAVSEMGGRPGFQSGGRKSRDKSLEGD